MEKLDICKEMKEVLQEIQKTIEMYNAMNLGEKLCITQEDTKDVKDMFICFYNEKHVGLFKKINLHSKVKYDKYDLLTYDSASVYLGVDSQYVGIKETHKGYNNYPSWKRSGECVKFGDEAYIATCNMENGMSFDDMRLIMYKEGKIAPYTIGKATSKEILDVLCYAANYFVAGMESAKEKRK